MRLCRHSGPLTNESSVKQVWDGINDIINPERNAKNLLKIENEEGIVEEPLQVAEEFNTPTTEVGRPYLIIFHSS